MIKIGIMVAIGALIGWMTNVFAIKLLFRPIQPVKLLFLPIQIQGLMPKRQKEIAHSIGETVEKELLNSEDIFNQLLEKTDKQKVLDKIAEHIRNAVSQKLPSLLPGPFKNMAIQYVDQMLVEEGGTILEALEKEVKNHVKNELDIASIVEEKINAFPFETLESIILDLAKKELKHIEALGGLLGGIIGFMQALIIQML